MNNKLANYYKYLVLIPGVLFGLFFIFKTGVTSSLSKQFTLSDDVMISMTYAKTLAESGSFVWYESSPRVQGYTNFLWTIFLTLIHLFNLSGSLNALFVSLLRTFFGLIRFEEQHRHPQSQLFYPVFLRRVFWCCVVGSGGPGQRSKCIGRPLRRLIDGSSRAPFCSGWVGVWLAIVPAPRSRR